MDPILRDRATARAARDRRRGAGARCGATRDDAPEALATWAASASTPARTWGPMVKAAWWSRTMRITRARSACFATGGAEKKYHQVLKGLQLPVGREFQGAVAEGQAPAPGKLDRSPSCRGRALRQVIGRQRSAHAGGHELTPDTSIMSMRYAAVGGQQWQEALNAQGIHTGISLSDSRSSAARVCRSGLRSRRISALRAGGERGAIAPHVCRVDSGTMRVVSNAVRSLASTSGLPQALASAK
jgi:hypothetical protein